MEKLTKNGYRISKNGKPILSINVSEISQSEYKGKYFKENGDYYFYSRKQGNNYIYTL